MVISYLITLSSPYAFQVLMFKAISRHLLVSPTIRPRKIGRTVQAMKLDRSLGSVVDLTMNSGI
jgi:hypothetical protein